MRDGEFYSDAMLGGGEEAREIAMVKQDSVACRDIRTHLAEDREKEQRQDLYMGRDQLGELNSGGDMETPFGPSQYSTVKPVLENINARRRSILPGP